MDSRIGIALYEKGNSNGRNNIACAYGGKPFSFAASTDLPSHTLWITNLSSDELYASGLYRNPRFANDSYFRTRLSQMVQELGLTEITIEEQVVVLAEMLGCAAMMLKSQLHLGEFPALGMSHAVGQMFGISEHPKKSLEYFISEAACQRFTSCERTRRYEHADVFSFWFPRAHWAERMLELPVPTGNLKKIALHSLPAMGTGAHALAAWAFENTIPLFARVNIRALDERVGKLMNYGAGAMGITSGTKNGKEYDARNFREWCALPELEFLANFGDIQIQEVVCAEGWRNHGLRTYNSRRSSVSYAYGLAAENLWVGTLRRNNQNLAFSKTLSTAWLQAEDRMRCLKTAIGFFDAGMEITSYGNGRIGVACPKSVRALIPLKAREAGMLYPASLGGLTAPNGPVNSLSVQQSLITSKQFYKSVQLDQACLKELESVFNASKPSAV